MDLPSLGCCEANSIILTSCGGLPDPGSVGHQQTRRWWTHKKNWLSPWRRTAVWRVSPEWLLRKERVGNWRRLCLPPSSGHLLGCNNSHFGQQANGRRAQMSEFSEATRHMTGPWPHHSTLALMELHKQSTVRGKKGSRSCSLDSLAPASQKSQQP